MKAVPANEQNKADSSGAGAPVADLMGLLEYRAETQPDFPIYRYLRDGEDVAETLSFAEVALKAKPWPRPCKALPPRASGSCCCICRVSNSSPLTSVAFTPRTSRFRCRRRANRGCCKPWKSSGNRPFGPAGSGSDHPGRQGKAEEHFASLPEFAAMRWLATDTLAAELAADWRQPQIAAEDIAFLQYTSGSTSLPKGVILTHANLMHNMRYFDQSGIHNKESRLLTWLPPFHDLGLIYGLLTPVYCGMACYILPNAAFVQRPARWLEAISRFGITHTMGPNFAFDLCLNGVGDEQLAGLDLSRWQHALNGAEPVRMQTMRAFAERFAAAGFDLRVFSPSWGWPKRPVSLPVYTMPAAASGGRSGRRRKKSGYSRLNCSATAWYSPARTIRRLCRWPVAAIPSPIPNY